MKIQAVTKDFTPGEVWELWGAGLSTLEKETVREAQAKRKFLRVTFGYSPAGRFVIKMKPILMREVSLR